MATDRDGRDATITYGLGDDAPSFVDINPQTGLIRTSELLPEVNGSVTRYPFNVTATDSGSPSPRVGTAVVLIAVFSPENEFEPEFDQDLYNVSVPENSPVGTLVVTVTITDDDGPGPSGTIRNVTLGGSDSHLFDISAPVVVGNNMVEANITTRLVFLL